MALSIAGFTIFLLVNKDFIKNKTIQALNEQLQAEVKINGNIDVTFFSSFPKLNVSFDQVVIKDKLREGKNLAELGNVSVSLNPWRIFKKDYTIEGLILSDGYVYLFTDKAGDSNFLILKESDEQSSESNLIQLKQINLNNIELTYQNKSNGTFINIFTKSSSMAGLFYEEDFDINLKTEIASKDLIINETNYLPNLNIQGKLKLSYTGKDGCFVFTDNEISVEGNAFTINGQICTSNKTIDLKAQAEGSNLQNALGLLPKSWLQLDNIKGDGAYFISTWVQGSFDQPQIDLSFEIQNGNLDLLEHDIHLHNLQVKGAYSNRTQTGGSLQLNNFSFQSDESQFKGSLQIPNLNKIVLDAALSGHLDKDLLAAYLPKAYELTAGSIDFDQVNMQIIQQDSTWKLKKIEGAIDLVDLKGQIVSLNLPFILSGNLNGKENYLSAQNFIANIGENHLNFNGELRNLIEIALNSNPEVPIELGLDGILRSNYFNLNDFIKDNETNNSVESKPIGLPPIKGNLSIFINQFEYQKLTVKNLQIQAQANQTSYNFVIDNAEALGGKFQGNLQTAVTGNDFEVNLQCNIQQVDMQKLFIAFNNFDQDGLTSENIKGQLNAQLMMSATWRNFSEFDSKSFLMQSHLELKDGELINFAPLLSLSGKLEVEQLQKLYFTDLSCDVSIKNEVINIPMTEIQSNLLSLQAGGQHYFDGRIDYKLVLNLKNLLAAKFKKNKTTEEDYVNDAKGGINIYISMTGTSDNPIISYDKKSVKEKIKTDFKEEKMEFKNLFKKEELSEFEKNEVKFEELKEEDKYLEWEE